MTVHSFERQRLDRIDAWLLNWKTPFWICQSGASSLRSKRLLIFFFLLLSQLSRGTSRGNACYAGYGDGKPLTKVKI